VTEVIFSADSNAPNMIGTGIFKKTIGHDVVHYISQRLKGLPSEVSSRTLQVVRLQELSLLRTALLADKKCSLERKEKYISRRNREAQLGTIDVG